MNWSVYVLRNPRTLEVRYVGITVRPLEARLADHVKESVAEMRTHKQRWIASLVSIGLMPLIEVVESGCGDGCLAAEKRWIAHYLAAGARLVNGTEGGDTPVGHINRERWSEAARKRWAARSPEQRAAIARTIHAGMTPDERRAMNAKARASLSREDLSNAGKKGIARANAARSPESRSAATSKRNKTVWARLSAEERGEEVKRRRLKRRHSASN